MGIEENRLQSWISNGQVAISQLFFKHYKTLHLSEEEAMLIMQLHAFVEKGIDFPSHTDLAQRMALQEQQIMLCLQGLVRKGFVAIEQGTSQDHILYEKINLMPLWSRLVDCELSDKIQDIEKQDQLEEGKLFQMFEQELGRLLSPIEIETISMWIDQDGHTPDLIQQALKEAVLSDKITLKYIDRILFDWKKKNIKTTKAAIKHSKDFRSHTMKTVAVEHSASNPVKKAPFYNWLEERE
ncbi:MAG: DnaD domain-containing protein [Kurthia sp.]|nr:DnaD domain-containing protein [Candidatus Kurthia equi]